MAQKQLTLFKQQSKEFGGSLLQGQRKSARPLSTKSQIHLVVRGNISESGSLLRHRDLIEVEIRKWAKRFYVKISHKAIASNHMHIDMKINTIEGYRNFIRVFLGQLAQKLKIKWEYRPYTRLIRPGHPYRILKDYILQNHNEAVGNIFYSPRKHSNRKYKK